MSFRRHIYSELSHEEAIDIVRFAAQCGGLAGIPQLTFEGWQVIVCWREDSDVQVSQLP